MRRLRQGGGEVAAAATSASASSNGMRGLRPSEPPPLPWRAPVPSPTGPVTAARGSPPQPLASARVARGFVRSLRGSPTARRALRAAGRRAEPEHRGRFTAERAAPHPKRAIDRVRARHDRHYLGSAPLTRCRRGVVEPAHAAGMDRSGDPARADQRRSELRSRPPRCGAEHERRGSRAAALFGVVLQRGRQERPDGESRVAQRLAAQAGVTRLVPGRSTFGEPTRPPEPATTALSGRERRPARSRPRASATIGRAGAAQPTTPSVPDRLPT